MEISSRHSEYAVSHEDINALPVADKQLVRAIIDVVVKKSSRIVFEESIQRIGGG